MITVLNFKDARKTRYKMEQRSMASLRKTPNLTDNIVKAYF